MAIRQRPAGALLILAFASACKQAPSTSAELQSLIAREVSPAKAISREVWSDAQKFYAARQHHFGWVSGDGPDETTLQALNTLQDAASHGLKPVDYGEPELRALHDRLAGEEAPNDGFAERLAELD